MSGTAPKNIYTIPAGLPFAKTLAGKLLEDHKDSPETLASHLILLPTRRACRTLQEAFLQLSNGKPLLLPRLQPIGDIDEEELTLSIAGTGSGESFLNLPPAIAPLRRQLLLARAIMKIKDFNQGPDHALALARALGRLMDQIHTEGLDMADLAKIVPEEFADHWQITLKFLEILSETWPQILAEQGRIDVAERRNLLIRRLTAYWADHPPQTPVIAAGSTGSIPATADLLALIATWEHGQVVLPGLDQDMDEESWAALEDSHPQAGFQHLFEHLKLDRHQVRLWPYVQGDAAALEKTAQRQALAGEIMRPAETTKTWTQLREDPAKVQHFEAALDGLRVLACTNEREEADVIAALMRGILEDPEKTAALITPDRTLARRVAAGCKRWGITLDDSAGAALDQSSLGAFLMLSVQACIDRFAPVSLLSLLKHPYCRAGLSQKSYDAAVHQIEMTALRGLKPAPGFESIIARMEGKNVPRESVSFLKEIQRIMERFINGSGEETTYKFNDLLKSHILMIETLSKQEHKEGHEILWAGEAGEAAAGFMADLLEHSDLLPRVTLASYRDILQTLMTGITIRPAYGTHPRLRILGQLEARLVDADLIILGGLNEGVWPPDPGHDPWMSRPMRKAFGLPGYERSVGLAAHDFVQGFCNPNVVITRARRCGGAPTVPARWLQRLLSVMDAAGLDAQQLQDETLLSWARGLDHYDNPVPYLRPEPRPGCRPDKLSVTRIETWLKDPYSIYAGHILKLRKLKPLEREIDAAVRGDLLHEILHRFVSAYRRDLPEDAYAQVQIIAHCTIEMHHDDPAAWSFWWPRFERAAHWFLDYETSWRENAENRITEAKGGFEIATPGGNFTLTGRVDRIDVIQTAEGPCGAVIDYKSGGQYPKTGIRTCALPQLPLEGLILEQGGFPDLKSMPAGYLGYWVMSGGPEAGKAIEINDNVTGIVDKCRTGLSKLLVTFEQPGTPYYSLPRPENAPRFNDYEHLARVKEWSALGDADSDSGSEAA